MELQLDEAFLQSRNLLPKAERRGAHRRKRPRRPLPGMMLHQDASRHAWLSDGLDLVVTMDDATSEIYSAFLVEEEGTDSTFRALLEVFRWHGACGEAIPDSPSARRTLTRQVGSWKWS